MNVNFTAVVDYPLLLQTVRNLPSGMRSAGAVTASFQFGPYTCDTIEEVWQVAVETVRNEQLVTYERLKDFAP